MEVGRCPPSKNDRQFGLLSLLSRMNDKPFRLGCRTLRCISVRTILLGEAPKRDDGFAFDAGSWTTQQIAGAVGADPFHLNKVFWVMNIFEDPQQTTRRGFDRFSVAHAAEEIHDIWFESQRVICVGTRVAAAMELSLNLSPGAIPENQFRRFDRTSRGGGWQLARIPHPSGLRGTEDPLGLVLPPVTRQFLRSATTLMTVPPTADPRRRRWR